MTTAFRILESFSLSKTGHGSGDDALFLSDHFAAVIDGETDKSVSPGAITGQSVAIQIVEAIGGLAPDADARTAVDAISRSVDEMYASRPEQRRSGASLVMLSASRREIWQVGDCRYSVDGTAHIREKAIDAVASGVRSAYLEALLRSGSSLDRLLAQDPGRDLIMPLLLESAAFRNVDDEACMWAFGTIDGSPVPDRFLEIASLPSSQVTVTLASDGYPWITDNLEEAEAHLRAALLMDPLCTGELRSTKGVAPGNASFDDRSWLRVLLEAI